RRAFPHLGERGMKRAGRWRGVVGTTLIGVGAAVLVASAAAKFARLPAVVTEPAAAGVADQMLTFLASLEIVSGLLFLIPTTRSAGLLLASSYLGGAIATQLEHHHAMTQPAVVLGLVWLGTWLRHPAMLWSL